MAMLPTSRRAFVQKHFSPYLDRKLLALDGSDLSKMAVSLNRPPTDRRRTDHPVTDLTEKKDYLEWAIGLLAAEVWFESVSPDPREFEERLSSIGDHAFKLATELARQSRPDLISDYFSYLYEECLVRDRGQPALGIDELTRALEKMSDLSRRVARGFAPYTDRRQRHDLGLKSYLLSLVFVARKTRAGVSLPTKEEPDKPTSFTDFAVEALRIGSDKAIVAIQQSSYLPGPKSRALNKLESYGKMSLNSLTVAVRRLRNIQGGNSRDFIDEQLLPLTSRISAYS